MKGDPIVLDAYTAQIVFGIKPTRIRQWVKRGLLVPCGRRERRHLFDERDLKRLLDQR